METLVGPQGGWDAPLCVEHEKQNDTDGSLVEHQEMSKKKKARASDFLEDAKTLKIGKKITVPEVYSQYVKPELVAKNRRYSTVTCIARDVGRFSQWWSTIASQPLPISKIRRKHLEAFRSWLGERGHSVALRNGAIRSVLQVLHASVKHELITHAPKLESLSHKGVAPKIFPNDEEIDRLWDAAEMMTWPNRDSQLRPLRYSATTGWRVAIVMYRVYGFRTQELIQLEGGFRPLQWSNIHAPGLTPNVEGRCECEHGWIAYVPQKQERVKPEPLVNPLTEITRAAINLVSDGPHRPSDIVLDWSRSGVSFYGAWHRLCEIANVKPRAASGVDRYSLKHLRKAATTAINIHRPGMAEHIVGHGADRSGQSAVSSKHYNNAEQAVVECMATMPMPESFKQLCGQ